MKYTILSARYSNSDHTAAEIQTAESDAVMISEADRPVEWAAFKAWERSNTATPHVPAIVKASPTIADLVSVLSPDQKEQLNARVPK